MVARLGGDEFVLLIENFHDSDSLQPIFEKIKKNVTDSISLDNKGTFANVSVGLSMGVCVYPNAGIKSSDMLMRYADRALYESKENKAERSIYWTMYRGLPE